MGRWAYYIAKSDFQKESQLDQLGRAFTVNDKKRPNDIVSLNDRPNGL